MKYIAVSHTWFVHTLGFKTKTLDSETMEDALNEAKIITMDNTKQFKSCATTVVEIADEKVLVKDFDHKLNKIPMWVRGIFGAK